VEPSENSTVESRLALLEGENRRLAKETRRLKTLGASALLVFLALMTVGARMALQNVNANRLSVTDENGRLRHDLGHVSTDNAGIFAMYDQNGRIRIAIDADDDGYCGFRVFNPSGQETWRSP
jgi:hypothetical protein